MVFIWNEGKNQRNLAKHGISFADSLEIFDDPKAFTKAARTDEGEYRYMTIGLIKGKAWAILWTMRDGDIRILA